MRVGAAACVSASAGPRGVWVFVLCAVCAVLNARLALSEAPTAPPANDAEAKADKPTELAAKEARTDAQNQHRAREHFQQGQEAYRQGKWERARALFEAADSLLPSPELAFNLALVCERSGRASEAVAYYRRYLKKADTNMRERREVRDKIAALSALAARQQGQLKLPPPSGDQLTAEARRFFTRGLALYKRDQRRAAMAAFMAAYRLRQTPELLFNLALISEELGHRRDAIDYYQAYLRRLPRAHDAGAVRSRIQALTKPPEEPDPT